MEVAYKILRSRRKTLSLCVTREGEVVVRAPLGVSKEYISTFVVRHTEWIKKRLCAVQNRPVLDLSDGSQLVLFGSGYRIETGRARIQEGMLYLPAERREEALARFLKQYALEVMQLFTARIAERYGFQYSRVRISSARSRWGSCNKDGIISYTFRVAFLPPLLCEYVVVHELAHTVCFDHSSAFWREVERVLPDWKMRRKALKSSKVIDFLP